MESYILDNSSTAKYQRLDLMSKILDPRSRDSLTSWGCVMVGTASKWEPDFNIVHTCELKPWAKAWGGILKWGSN
jgi:hypothetical protein